MPETKIEAAKTEAEIIFEQQEITTQLQLLPHHLVVCLIRA